MLCSNSGNRLVKKKNKKKINRVNKYDVRINFLHPNESHLLNPFTFEAKPDHSTSSSFCLTILLLSGEFYSVCVCVCTFALPVSKAIQVATSRHNLCVWATDAPPTYQEPAICLENGLW